MIKTINLAEYRAPNVKAFIGRKLGEELKNKIDLLGLDQQYDQLHIIVPEHIWVINPSFLEALFEEILMVHGRTEFYRKYQFICPGHYNIATDLEIAVDRILRKYSL